MSNDHGSGRGADRGPSGPLRPDLESKVLTSKGQEILTGHFVHEWLRPSSRVVPVAWLKVVAEWVIGRTLYGDGQYVWIEQATLERTLAAAGFRVRHAKGDPNSFVGCAPKNAKLSDWRFFKRGGRL